MSVKNEKARFCQLKPDFEKMSVNCQLKKYFEPHLLNETGHTRMHPLSSRFSEMSGYGYTRHASYPTEFMVLNVSVKRFFCQLNVS